MKLMLMVVDEIDSDGSSDEDMEKVKLVIN